MKRLVVTALMLCAAIAPSSMQSSSSFLDDEQIKAAIALGQSNKDLKPVRVAKRASLIKSAMVYEMGQLYTPTLRVALAARAAKSAYKEFTIDDAKNDVAGSYLLVVLPPMDTDGGNKAQRAEVETVLALPKGSADISRAIRPLWTKEDVSTYQNLFGATWAEKTIVAAFDSTILQPDIEIVAVYRTMPKFGGGPSKRELRGVIFDKIETSK